MEKSLEQKLKDFKHILECFVAYLNWASNRKKNEEYRCYQVCWIPWAP